MKKIVICADGTWNRPEKNSAKDFPTNHLSALVVWINIKKLIAMVGNPAVIIDCFAMLSDTQIKTFFAAGYEVKGLQQGMQQGTQKALIRMLEKKFGSVPNDIKGSLQQADEEQLLSWVEQTLTANSLGDIFAN